MRTGTMSGLRRRRIISTSIWRRICILCRPINTLNQAESEGETAHPTGKIAALVPAGSDYDNAHIISTDEAWFWQSPEK